MIMYRISSDALPVVPASEVSGPAGVVVAVRAVAWLWPGSLWPNMLLRGGIPL
jgi:hypothetical protein